MGAKLAGTRSWKQPLPTKSIKLSLWSTDRKLRLIEIKIKIIHFGGIGLDDVIFHSLEADAVNVLTAITPTLDLNRHKVQAGKRTLNYQWN
ncbi:hypothetical protein Pyn_25763 [Prunus yedoensis var. nudiflora]|uniref:Uncharacterized protein n=1 Tax=Prunus yedoensis var. nudiflora TaxID=2094558 RepID=A0A314YNP1_PRUYE|nr:hypothetical protein Pyn_25763 [Prunus yedoensis var. nudiflora]